MRGNWPAAKLNLFSILFFTLDREDLLTGRENKLSSDITPRSFFFFYSVQNLIEITGTTASNLQIHISFEVSLSHTWQNCFMGETYLMWSHTQKYDKNASNKPVLSPDIMHLFLSLQRMKNVNMMAYFYLKPKFGKIKSSTAARAVYQICRFHGHKESKGWWSGIIGGWTILPPRIQTLWSDRPVHVIAAMLCFLVAAI